MNSMEIEGWILDVEPGDKGLSILVVDIDSNLHTINYNVLFQGYIMPIGDIDPELLARDIAGLDEVIDAWVEEWFKPPYYRSKVPIIVFSIDSMGLLYKVYSIVRRIGYGYIVNDYPHPLIETLWRYGLKPSTKVWIGDNRVRVLEDSNSIDYTPPPFITLKIKLLRGNRKIYSINEEPDGIEIIVNDEIVYRGSLGKGIELLEELGGHIGLASIVEKKYMDMVYPGLLNSVAPIWINVDSMFTGIHGLIEWSRLSYIPVRLLSDASIGNVLTTIEALRARKRKYLVIRGHGRIEPWRSMRDFIQYDRGGTVYTPKSGLYWRVCQIDFCSLYPSIIAKYNISGETVDDPYCRDYIEPPGSGHKVCIDHRGLVADVMEWLVSRKEAIRDLINSGRSICPKEILNERMEAIKWILVASFGYLGYRNSLFGSIMAHETVTSIDRYIMAIARRAVEEYGYRVIHVLVDSLFIDNYGKSIDCNIVNRIIEDATGFKARIEAEYTWLVIPSSSHGFGYSNRYFGRLVNGILKIKGLYCVREDTPPLIKDAQLEALKILGKVDNPDKYREALKEIMEIKEKYRELIESGRVPIEKLVIIRNIVKDKPRSRHPGIKILEQLDYQTPKVAYIVAPKRKYVPIENNPVKYSKKYYIELLEKAFKEIMIRSAQPGHSPSKGSLRSTEVLSSSKI